MDFELFFKPTPVYKEYLLLSLLVKKKNVTQRDIATKIKISASMVNIYLDEYEKKGLIKRVYASPKAVTYFITEKGEDRRRLLNIQYLESALSVYNEAKLGCYAFFKKIVNMGLMNILFYGAGEVAEIMLSVLNDDNLYNLNVLAIIDDDNKKQGKSLVGKKIISLDEIDDIQYDGILISTYSNSKVVYYNLINKGIHESKIIQFFES